MTEVSKAYQKDYYQRHKAEKLEYQKRYYQKHKARKLKYQNKYQHDNKDKVRPYRKQWYRENVDYFKQCQEAYNTKHQKQRKHYSLKQYGLSIDDYKQMWIDQKGCCAICGKYQFEFRKALFVDHCHKTGKVRGLLCSNCNMGLGNFKDALDLLDKAKEYLLKERN